jgi:hypothetical protein
MRTMYDSVDVQAIPPTATMVAAYANGRWKNYDAMRARFPAAVVVSISVVADHTQLAHVLDIEVGDAAPSQFYSWARSMANAGVIRPTAYCNRSTVPSVLAGRPRGVIVDLWVADWTGKAHPLTFQGANVVAVQYASPAQVSGGHFDLSAVYDASWHAR